MPRASTGHIVCHTRRVCPPDKGKPVVRLGRKATDLCKRTDRRAAPARDSGTGVPWDGGANTGCDRHFGMMRHLHASVPGERAAKVSGELDDTWGRFAYVPCEDAFIAIPGFNDANVWLYKE